MSTVDTSTWNPDADLNVEIEGIPLNADASIVQTWQALRVLMAAVKGDGDAIKSMIDVMQGATASADGVSGLVPKPEAGDQDKFLRGDGMWGVAGEASSVAWANVTGKPSSFTPSSHAHGNLTNDGKLSTASRAVVTDGNGAVGVSSVTAAELGHLSGVTSAVQTQIDGRAADSEVVKLTGDQDILGAKTFLGTFTVSGAEIFLQSTSLDVSSRPSSTINKYFRCIDKNRWSANIIQFHNTSNSTTIRLMCRTYTDTSTSDSSLPHVEFLNYNPASGTPSMEFRPSSSSITLGASNAKWGQIYSTSSTISTSDARLKTMPESIPDSVLDAWEKINFVQFKMLDSVEKKGSKKARLHSGLVAQDIEEAFKSRGLDAGAYGLFCWDEWEARPEERDENGVVVEAARPAGDEYSLRYEEALCMEAACQRRRADRLEKRIAALEAALKAKEG